MNKKHKFVYFLILSMAFGCSTPIASNTLPTHAKNNDSINQASNLKQQNGFSESSEVPKVAGSELPDQWISSKDKAINCRIKKWTSYPSGTNIKIEFVNTASNKPVNIVYTLVIEDDEGGAIPIFNPYRSEQFTITDFKPLLKKGETRLIETEPKHVTAFSVKLKGCRIAMKQENYLTINPEMVDRYP
jgi:hypothetical protein